MVNERNVISQLADRNQKFTFPYHLNIKIKKFFNVKIDIKSD